MNQKGGQIEFYGFLGRWTVSNERAELRFYDYDFPTTLNANPVLRVEFSSPEFDQSKVADLNEVESQIIVHEDHVEIIPIEAETTILRAKSIFATKIDYDSEDYIRHAKQLIERIDQLHNDLAKSHQRSESTLKLANELLRRAEIKAAASENLEHRQDAAISVLQRLINRLSEK